MEDANSELDVVNGVKTKLEADWIDQQNQIRKLNNELEQLKEMGYLVKRYPSYLLPRFVLTPVVFWSIGASLTSVVRVSHRNQMRSTRRRRRAARSCATSPTVIAIATAHAPK